MPRGQEAAPPPAPVPVGSVDSKTPDVPADNQADLGDLVQAVKAVCQIDPVLATRRKLQQATEAAQAFAQAQVPATQLPAFSAWWMTYHWLGQRGQPPTPAQLRDDWGRFTHFEKHGPPDSYAPPGDAHDPRRPFSSQSGPHRQAPFPDDEDPLDAEFRRLSDARMDAALEKLTYGAVVAVPGV